MKIISYPSSFPNWCSKDRKILSYLAKRYKAIAISFSNIWELSIWNRKLLKRYDFLLSKDKCPILFLTKENFYTLFSDEIEHYLSGSLAILFLSNNDLKEIKELFKNMYIKGMDVEDLICHFHQVHIYIEKIYDDIDEHKTYIHYIT